MMVAGAAVSLLVAGGCSLFDSGTAADGSLAVKKGFDLKKYGAANPEGLTMHRGDVYFTAQNFFIEKPAQILRITEKEKLETVLTFSADVKPLGLAFGPDNNLYVADNQFSDTDWGKSRLLRVTFRDDGKPVSVEVVARGFNHINGVAWKGSDVYVTETVLARAEDGVTTGAVFKFALAQLDAKKPVNVKPVATDPHCLLTITTHNPEVPYSANGLTFDGFGNLFVCSFGDAVMWRATFDSKGAVASCKPWADAKKVGMMSLDGAHFDVTEKDKIWVTDLIGNSVGYIGTEAPPAAVVARGAAFHDAPDGGLDTPADVIRRGDKLYVVNFNLGFGGHKATEHQAVSVINLK
jgi:hypothetical protein